MDIFIVAVVVGAVLWIFDSFVMERLGKRIKNVEQEQLEIVKKLKEIKEKFESLR